MCTYDRFLQVLWLVALGIFLTACTNSPSSNPPATTQPNRVSAPTRSSNSASSACVGEIVTVRMDDWSNTDEARAARTEVLSAFQAAHPCIQVEVVELPQDRRQEFELNRIQTGTASDLIAAGIENIPLYSEVGGLADLTPYIQADPGFKPDEIYFKGVWRAGFYKGKPYAINKDFSVSAVYVNIGLFEKAKLALPKEGWTYDDYLRLAQQLTLDKNGNNATSPNFDAEHIVQYGTTVPWTGETHVAWFRGFENVLYSYGAHAISPDASTTSGYLNSPRAVQAWSFYRDLISKYHVAPTVTELSSLTDNNVTLFMQGKLAMVGAYWGPWFQEVFNAIPNFKWAVTSLPTGPGGHKGVIMWLGWGLNQKTAHPREAWELLKWLSTIPGQRVFSRRALTQIKSLAAEQQRINDPFWGVFLAETEYVDVIDDALHPRFNACVASGPTAEFLYRTWEADAVRVDIQSELDKLAAAADKCLATR